MFPFAERFRGAALALTCATALLTNGADAAVITNGTDFTVSYSTDLQIGTINGNPITSLYIFETDGVNISVERAPSLPGLGPSTVTHIVPFRPTASLLIGLDLLAPGVSDEKTHIVMFMDAEFFDNIAGLRFSQAFPAVGGNPRLTHPDLIAALLGADAGDAASLAILTDFFINGAGAAAAFDPAGSFRVGEFSFVTAIDVPEPASALLLGGALAAVALRRRRRRA